MTVADRATIANMAPEYGATMGFFPIDDQTLNYLRLTGRDEKSSISSNATAKSRACGGKKTEPTFTEVLELDLATVMPSVAGPRRPQDRVELRSVKQSFRSPWSTFSRKKSAKAPRRAWTAGPPKGPVSGRGR
jgi:aconitate hydratase